MFVSVLVSWVGKIWHGINCEGNGHSLLSCMYMLPVVYFMIFLNQMSNLHFPQRNHGRLIRNHPIECAVNSLFSFVINYTIEMPKDAKVFSNSVYIPEINEHHSICLVNRALWVNRACACKTGLYAIHTLWTRCSMQWVWNSVNSDSLLCV